MLLTIAVIFFPLAAFGGPKSTTDPAVFFQQVNATLAGATGPAYDRREHVVGQKKFVEANWLIPGQPEISVLNSMAKLTEDAAEWGTKWRAKAGRWKLAHGDGQSLLPLSQPSQVVLTDFGMVIVDGHHHLFANLFAGGTKTPVEVVGDYRGQSRSEVFAALKSQDLVFSRRMDGSAVSEFGSLTAMQDNPNRYLASLLAMKLKASYKGDRMKVKIKSTPEYPLWVKLNGGVPFIEFYIAEILHEAGIVYQSEWQGVLPTEVMANARNAIAKALQAGTHPALRHVLIFLSDAQAQSMSQDRALLTAFVEGYVVGKGLQCKIMADAL